jgi:hypothetical protein
LSVAGITVLDIASACLSREDEIPENALLLVHAIGDGDLGFAPAGSRPDLEGDPQGASRDRRPLRKVFEGLAASRQVSRLALLGTTNNRPSPAATFAEHAQEIRTRLTSGTGLYGTRLDHEAVSVIEVAEPTIFATSAALGRWLIRNRAAEILVTCGSGSFALSVGAVCAALETHHPVRIAHIDTPSQSYTLNCPSTPDLHLKSWLLRHRFWDALAEVDPDHESLWRLLAARQAANTDLLQQLCAPPAPWPGSLSHLWPTVRAALSERVGRGEAVDYALLRAWYTEQLHRLFDVERSRLSIDSRQRLERLLHDLHTRAEDNGRLSARLREAARFLTEDLDSACSRMIRDSALTEQYTAAATHRAHLEPQRLDPGPLPPTLLAAVDRWEKDDPAIRLIGQAGQTTWPIAGSGDVLALMAVGLDRPGLEAEDRQTVDKVHAELWRRRARLLRQGALRLRLLASSQSHERAHRLAREIASQHGDVEVQVIEDVQGELVQVRDAILKALHAGPAPTGRTGSGSPRDVDEIVLLLNPGPPMTNYGMIAAGVIWSLIAACPLFMTELTRVGHATRVQSGPAVLARLGADRMLTRLVISAVDRLDLRTARRLAERGSAHLRAMLPVLERLEADVYGSCPELRTEPERVALARQRLRLVAHVHHDHPGLAAYLAVTTLRPSLFSWNVWNGIRKRSSAADELSHQANHAAHGHALDRQRQGVRRKGTHRRPAMNEVLERAIHELGGKPETDRALLKQHQSVKSSLESLFRETG